MSINSKTPLSLLLTGLISGFLGLIVLIGWYAHSTTLVQVLPAFVPMQYNTALGFFLYGVGAALLVFSRLRPALACGLAVAAVGLLTLLEYVFGWDLGIDQLLMQHYITVKTSHPGRMAPNTALCFLLSGATLLWLVRLEVQTKHLKTAGITGSIIAGLGSVALFGYLSGLETTYGWGHLTRMALHTSAGFVCIGAGVLAFSWRCLRAARHDFSRWLVYPVCVGSVTVVIVLWQSLSVQPGVSSTVSTIVLLVGLFLALLITTLIYYIQMAAINQDNLRLEIQERQRVEGQLQAHRGHLEELVEERTSELRHATAAAETANRAKSEFLANMSHEIRTPMNAILGFTDILSNLVADAQQREYLRSIQTSGKSLLTLINDILDLSKVETGKLELENNAFNIRAVFADMKSVFSREIAEKNLDFRLKIDPDLPPVLVLDEARLRQVLINIIGNAVKFTDAGHIGLAVRCTAQTPDRIDVEIAVEDSGIGISEDQQEKIFGAFEQQKGQDANRYGGTGLGLAITRRLIEMMNGEISITSQLGAGSTFHIILKSVEVASAEALADRAEVDLDIASVCFSSATVLVADDVALNRDLVRGYLDGYNLTIAEAENGQEAIQVCRQQRPDIVLMDIKMPVLDGFTATKRLKADAEFKNIPVIALTASVMKETEEELLEFSEGFLKKPVSQVELLAELMRFLDHTVSETDALETAPVAPEETSDTPLDAAVVARLPDLAHQLEAQHQTWEELCNTLTINDIEDFARHMRETGTEYDYPPLRLWAEDLQGQVGVFDMATLPQTLREFPAILEKIREIVSAT